mmetsp:Transcript_49231/g.132185  ORF Transcript_49231/g.132185 Transcript_49231/m.132185 type:complete len:225 (-) Transcript_49231:883-1557(-)
MSLRRRRMKEASNMRRRTNPSGLPWLTSRRTQRLNQIFSEKGGIFSKATKENASSTRFWMGVPVTPQTISERKPAFKAATVCLARGFLSSWASSAMSRRHLWAKSGLPSLSASEANVWYVVRTKSYSSSRIFCRACPWKTPTLKDGQCCLAWSSQFDSTETGQRTRVPYWPWEGRKLSAHTSDNMVIVLPRPMSSQSKPPRGNFGASTTNELVITLRYPLTLFC